MFRKSTNSFVLHQRVVQRGKRNRQLHEQEIFLRCQLLGQGFTGCENEAGARKDRLERRQGEIVAALQSAVPVPPR
jgi:hypothetical protein